LVSGPIFTSTNNAIVHFYHAGQFAHCAGAEHLVRAVNILDRQVGFPDRNIFRGADFEDRRRVIPFRHATT
jgi:hypothetical protein